MSKNFWAYSVTTVPGRFDTLLPRTLESLKAGGFPEPRLTVDGIKYHECYEKFGLPMTFLCPNIRPFGAWVLSLWELWIRFTNYQRYAIFQDDLVCVKNLRQYLDRCEYPKGGYWNLYTFPENQVLAPPDRTGFYPSNQRGRGALALVFDHDAVSRLLSSPHIVKKPNSATDRAWCSIDGGVIEAFKAWAGPRAEFVHNPSLVQHTGMKSTMTHHRATTDPAWIANSWPGESFDAMELLEKDKILA